MRAADVMTTGVITVSPEASVQELARLLADHGISGAPVVDADGKLVGILSLADVAREAVQQKRRPHGEPLDEEVTTTLAAVSEPRASA